MKNAWILSSILLVAAAPAPPPLSQYVGRYPTDKIGGFTFVNHPEVRRAISRAVLNPPVRFQVLSNGTSVPIQQNKALIMSGSCQPHHCSDHNWTIVIAKSSGTAAVCYHNEELTGEGSRWFVDGHALLTTSGDCSSEVGGVPNEIVERLGKAN